MAWCDRFRGSTRTSGAAKTFRALRSSLLLPSLLLLTSVSVVSASDSTGDDLVAWLRRQGGVYNTKLEIRRVDPSDPSSRYGMFTNEALSSGDLLLSIPQNALLRPSPRDSDGGNDDDDDNDDNDEDCLVTRLLLEEMEAGDDSYFAPYVRYLTRDADHAVLPSLYSDAGKDLIRRMLRAEAQSAPLPPDDFDTKVQEWLEECGMDHDDATNAFAAMLVVQRGWDEVMIPVFDMMSHRNGKWLNTKSSSVRGHGDVRVTARRDVKAGEEIYTSYNFCEDCGNRLEGYGTPEIFRDYGFVEQYPQRWNFEGDPLDGVGFDVVNDDDDPDASPRIRWIGEEPSTTSVKALRFEAARLKSFAAAEFGKAEDDPSLPSSELESIRTYHEALVFALDLAVATAFGSTASCAEKKDETCEVRRNRYHDLSWDRDEHWDDYGGWLCPQAENLGRVDRGWEYLDTPDKVKSFYQELSFAKDPENDDVCFFLEDICQICGNYRPQYHESVVHIAAEFVPEVKRVLFVGGGDSMILHEVLKYPSLELVVGLELDQKVTRYCFKHFGTQPHWHDDRVQWWFGDAAKSLLMLPREWYGSFDLVLVDLSETVMSITVTEELDILAALALLSRRDGVFVKNELYITEMSDIFDHALLVHVWGDKSVPTICCQKLAFGSDGVDFLRAGRIEHEGVEKIFHETDPYALVHDVRDDTSTSYGCKDVVAPSEVDATQSRSPGILMILELENTAVALDADSSGIVEELIRSVLEKNGLTVVETATADFASDDGPRGRVVAFVTREGYAVARTWPGRSYVALDLHLWARFGVHEDLKNGLAAAFGARDRSSFRIVAGGIFGADGWREDAATLGPVVNKTCHRPPDPPRPDVVEEETYDAVLEELMGLLGAAVEDDEEESRDFIVVVVCGADDAPCRSADVLDASFRAIRLPGCSADASFGDDHGDGDDYATLLRLSRCENDVLRALEDALSDGRTIDAVVLDPRSTYESGRALHALFRHVPARERLLADDVLVVSTMLNVDDQDWQRGFVGRFQNDVLINEPLFRAELLFNDTSSSTEIGVTRSGDKHFVRHLMAAVDAVEKRTGTVSEVRNIQGGHYNYDANFVPSHFYLPSDYDQSDPLAQWRSQAALGHQMVLQLDVQGTARRIMKLLRGIDFQNTASEAVVEIGEGAMVLALWENSIVVILWDGRNHVDVNSFANSEEDARIHGIHLHGYFKKRLHKAKLQLLDEHPRGVGRVVNYMKDEAARQGAGADPHWAKHLVDNETANEMEK